MVDSAVTVATRVCDLEETESGKIKLFVNDNQTNVFENASINGEIPDPSTISGISWKSYLVTLKNFKLYSFIYLDTIGDIYEDEPRTFSTKKN